jgi:DNA-binding response OmpR family regulator
LQDKRILVVEDEPKIARLVQMHLQDEGWSVSIAPRGEDALTAARHSPYDLVVLDLRLPDLDGLEVCRRLREDRKYTPILMLTARSSEVDRVLGLEIGADDYLTKPFSVRELVARAKAIMRRVEMVPGAVEDSPQPPLEIAGLVIDRAKRTVTVHGRPVHLTAKEFDLLVQFAENPGRVYTRSQLLDLVWGYGASSYEHTVNSHINRLRGKIEEDPSNPHFVQTVWGVGYRFFDPSQPEA